MPHREEGLEAFGDQQTERSLDHVVIVPCEKQSIS